MQREQRQTEATVRDDKLAQVLPEDSRASVPGNSSAVSDLLH